MKTAVIAVAAAFVTGIVMVTAPVGAAGNPPVVNPLDINPYLVAIGGQPCQDNGSSVPLVGQYGQFYECQGNVWVAVTGFAERRAVGQTQVLYTTDTSTIPDGWLKADGSSFSAATYPELADALGGTTLPNLPTAGQRRT